MHDFIEVVGAYEHNLKNISVKIPKNKLVAITGPSGSGKSTFAKVLMGLETGTDGEVRHMGTDLSEIAVRNRSPKQIGSLQMVFQT